MKKSKLIFVTILYFCSTKISAQGLYDSQPYTFEFGAGLSAMNCITDLGGANGTTKYYFNEIKFKNFRASGSIYASATYYDLISARFQTTWGQVQSSDADIKGNSIVAVYKRNRNLSFKSNISETSLLFDFYPLKLIYLDFTDFLLDPYLTTGIGFFSFNPQTQYQGRWVDLKPLHTEGEGFPEYPTVHNYKLTKSTIPVGIGVRYNLSSKFNLRLEYLHRILSTDYLDDASSQGFINPAAFDRNLPPASAEVAKVLFNRTLNGRTPPRRGNPDNNDTYMSLSLKVGIVIGRENRPK